MRIFVISDIHVDYPVNMNWIRNLSKTDYKQDALILPGDVTHDMVKLEKALSMLRSKFAQVCFTPGNHELWCLQSDHEDSVEKFHQILALCADLDVATEPVKMGTEGGGVYVVPLFSWYVKPEEGEGSLFLPKPGEDPTLMAWSDNYFIRWPEYWAGEAASRFLHANQPTLDRYYDAPVISFSHFLPRQELIFAEGKPMPHNGPALKDAHRSFNFSRVAGDSRLDAQIRQLGAGIHVYGHQHRNRHRTIDGVTYISHCLGYQRERNDGHISDVSHQPKLIWDTASPEPVTTAPVCAGTSA